MYATHVTSFLVGNQRTVDAVGPGKVAYQMTMATTHDVNEAGLEHAAELLGATPQEPLRLCICVTVPKDAYHGPTRSGRGRGSLWFPRRFPTACACTPC